MNENDIYRINTIIGIEKIRTYLICESEHVNRKKKYEKNIQNNFRTHYEYSNDLENATNSG